MSQGSDYDEYSDYTGGYAPALSDGTPTIDTVDELLSRFTLDCHPDCTVKLRNKLGKVVLGADLTYSIASRSSSGALVVKPADDNSVWRRLRIDHTGTFTLRSSKLSWWVFTLDLHAHTNPFKRTTDVSFRVATKWDISTGEIRKKKRFTLGDGAEGRVHWNLHYNLPTIEGSLSNQQERDINADLGYAHFSLPKVELVVWPKDVNLRRLFRLPSATEDSEEGAKSSSTAAAGGSGGGGSCCGGKGGSGGKVAASIAAAAAPAAAAAAPLAAISAAAAAQRHMPWAGLRPGSRRGGSGGGSGSSSLTSGVIQLTDLRAHVFQLGGMEG